MTNNDEDEYTKYAPLIALGDQIQQSCDASNVDIVAFVFFDVQGRVEYRTKVGVDALKKALVAMGEML
jgi:hypothetical protein